MLHSILKIRHQVKLARTPPSTFLFLPINLSNSSISKGKDHKSSLKTHRSIQTSTPAPQHKAAKPKSKPYQTCKAHDTETRASLSTATPPRISPVLTGKIPAKPRQPASANRPRPNSEPAVTRKNPKPKPGKPIHSNSARKQNPKISAPKPRLDLNSKPRHQKYRRQNPRNPQHQSSKTKVQRSKTAPTAVSLSGVASRGVCLQTYPNTVKHFQ